MSNYSGRWKVRTEVTAAGERQIWKCQLPRVNYFGEICPYSVVVAEPARPEHQERAKAHREEHERIWHGSTAAELRQAVDDAVLAEAERVVREARR